MSAVSIPPLCQESGSTRADLEAQSLAHKVTDLRRADAAAQATCVMDYRLSPFCWTRLQAAARSGLVISLEMSAETREYAWEKMDAAGDFTRVTLFPEGEAHDAPLPEMLRRLHSALDEHRPATVAIVGWSFTWSLSALAWCLQNEVPSILLSDSTAISNSRSWFKEWIKRRLVKLYSVALVAGTPQRDYVTSLGIPSEHVFRGWDVVDNDYFITRSDEARRNSSQLRSRLQLPENYFISVSRFVEMKNVLGLIEAFAAYRATAGTQAWKLVLIGDGPLRPEILHLRRRLNLGNDLLLPGWKKYSELPAYYGLAGAFVLASKMETWGLVVNEAMASGLPVLVSERCGCSRDLVAHGRNGFTFDPFDVMQFAQLMTQLTGPNTDRSAMSACSREIIEHWSPAVWAESLKLASKTALSLPRKKRRIIDQLLLHLLTRR